MKPKSQETQELGSNVKSSGCDTGKRGITSDQGLWAFFFKCFCLELLI